MDCVVFLGHGGGMASRGHSIFVAILLISPIDFSITYEILSFK